jgi:hypothetical protein
VLRVVRNQKGEQKFLTGELAKGLDEQLAQIKSRTVKGGQISGKKNQVVNEKIRSGSGCIKTNIFIIIHTSLQPIHRSHCPPSLI